MFVLSKPRSRVYGVKYAYAISNIRHIDALHSQNWLLFIHVSPRGHDQASCIFTWQAPPKGHLLTATWECDCQIWVETS